MESKRSIKGYSNEKSHNSSVIIIIIIIIIIMNTFV